MAAFNCWALSVGDGLTERTTRPLEPTPAGVWSRRFNRARSQTTTGVAATAAAAVAADATAPAVPNERGVPSAPQDRQRGKTRTVESPADV